MTRIASGAAVWMWLASTVVANTIAVTEFMCDPIGENGGREWIELYNYAAEPVRINGWKLADENGEIADLPDVTIAGGDYLIVVCGPIQMPGRYKKEMFEREWLGGKSDPRVVGVANSTFRLSRAADQIIVRNARRQVVWSLAYTKDGTPGRATFLTGNKFTFAQFGTKSRPGVARQGNDNGVTGGELLGYEGNDRAKDEAAYESDVAGLEAEGGVNYRSVAQGGTVDRGTASPLKGHYGSK